MKILVVNGRFYTGNGEYADSVFADNGVIKETGGVNLQEKYSEIIDKVIDMEGRYVYPDFSGFIDNVEYDVYDIGDSLLSLYDRKMAEAVLEKNIGLFFSEGEICDMAAYDVDLIKTVTPTRWPEVKRLVKRGEIFYDEAEYQEEQWYNIMLSQQF